MVMSLILMRETYAPVILERKTARLRKETGNPKLVSKLDSGLSPKDLFLFSIIRPTKMLFCSTICLVSYQSIGTSFILKHYTNYILVRNRFICYTLYNVLYRICY